MLIPAVVGLVLYAPSFWIFAVVSIIILLALLEYNNLTALNPGKRLFEVPVIVFGLLTPAVFYSGMAGVALPLLVSALFFLFLAGIMAGGAEKEQFNLAALRTTGIVYVAVPLSYFISMTGLENGRLWILFFLTVIWFNDSLAYVTGRVAGRHKLSPVISPNKTVEGAAGGIISGAIAALVFNRLTGLDGRAPSIIVISVVIGVVGICGDLSESLIKRGAGVKDSGTIVPGHGGVLDRIDSMLFALPAFYYLLIFLNPVK